eukprot:scaffold2744_cov104-Isochrysis_galbana.AAC.2
MPTGLNPYSGKPYSKRYFEILETRKKLPVRLARLPRSRPTSPGRVAAASTLAKGSGHEATRTPMHSGAVRRRGYAGQLDFCSASWHREPAAALAKRQWRLPLHRSRLRALPELWERGRRGGR